MTRMVTNGIGIFIRVHSCDSWLISGCKFSHGDFMVNIALLGCAHIHTPGFVKTVKSRKDVMIKTVWDHDKERGQKYADDLEARFIGDVKTILNDPEVKAVVICSETNRHAD